MTPEQLEAKRQEILNALDGCPPGYCGTDQCDKLTCGLCRRDYLFSLGLMIADREAELPTAILPSPGPWSIEANAQWWDGCQAGRCAYRNELAGYVKAYPLVKEG